jgi:Ca-activated chloride channel family protein
VAGAASSGIRERDSRAVLRRACGGKRRETAPIEKSEVIRDIMLALDISGSMDKRDFLAAETEPVQRLAAVKRVLDRFIEERASDRVGLIVFGTKAYLQVPFTRDLETARALLEAIEVGMAGPHTALGDAIGLAIRTFETSRVDQRLLIVLTDGSDTGSLMSPLNAAEIAAQNGVEICTIGVGDPAGEGEDRVDFAVLEDIAARAGGAFFTAADEAGLATVYRRIDELAPRETKVQTYRPRQSLVHWPAGAAVVVGICIFLLSLLATGRRPASS